MASSDLTPRNERTLMPSPLRLKRTLDPSSNVDLDDVIVAKRSLSRLGHYEVPDFGLTRFPDESLFEGIKSFQRVTGLKVDGIAKPDGPTIQTLGQRVSRLKSLVTPSDYQRAASKPDAPTPEECDHHFYKVDIPVCRAIERRRGKRAAARCYHSAAARYAACLSGTPINQLPPLDTWNN